MEFENYNDLSSAGSGLSSGFQFEFYCTSCSRKWKSPFKPYRMGQLTGFLSRFSFLFGGMNAAARGTAGFSDYGSRNAREAALAEAIQQAGSLYVLCKTCKQAVCADCLDSTSSICLPCQKKAERERATIAEQEAVLARERSAHACPNCGTDNPRGRFCTECGFDMASTHKSCPSCGAMVLREARYCAECGHGF